MAYFANGTEGDYLDQQCGNCPLGEKVCPVFGVQMLFNYKQCNNPDLKEAMNNLIDEKGNCLLRPLVLKIAPKSEEKTILQYLEETK